MKRRVNKATASDVKLYKVLTADGHSPHITAYAWSLPTPNGDGTYTPGAWHEEPASVFKIGHGLHITPSPGHYVLRRDCTFYEVEASGYRENPLTDHHVVALRVRLVRPITSKEADRITREWDGELYARQAKADQKRQLDKARASAMRAKAGEDAARRKGVESPALTAFRLLVELTPTESWRDVNGCRFDALRYATEWLRFGPGDVATIYNEFKGHRWFNEGSGAPEGLYTLAIKNNNKSACLAWEQFFGRKAWWCRSRDSGARKRLHVGSQVRFDGVWHRVTSFREDYLNAVRESDGRVVRLTRKQIDPKPARAAKSGMSGSPAKPIDFRGRYRHGLLA